MARVSPGSASKSWPRLVRSRRAPARVWIRCSSNTVGRVPVVDRPERYVGPTTGASAPELGSVPPGHRRPHRGARDRSVLGRERRRLLRAGLVRIRSGGPGVLSEPEHPPGHRQARVPRRTEEGHLVVTARPTIAVPRDRRERDRRSRRTGGHAPNRPGRSTARSYRSPTPAIGPTTRTRSGFPSAPHETDRADDRHAVDRSSGPEKSHATCRGLRRCIDAARRGSLP